MRNLLFILLFPIFVCSCTSEAVIVQKLESWLERHANNYSYCVIIPGAPSLSAFSTVSILDLGHWDR